MKVKPKSVESLKCSHCEKVFKYNSERMRHEISHSPHFECDVCFKKFSFVSALRRHQKQHERTGNVRCEECDRKFRDEMLLKRHIKYAHKGTFTCPKCSSTFSSDIALRTHMKTHKPVSERRFKCSHDGCGKSFNFSHHLKHHELTHSNVKQHFCAVCGKGFIQSHHLKTHLKTHNPSESVYCEFPECNKKFSTEYAKKRHIMAAHKNRPDSGISSDSNSWDTPVKFFKIQKEPITLESNNTAIEHLNYLENSPKYLSIDDPNAKVTVLEDEKPEVLLPIGIDKVYTEVINAKTSSNNDIDDCKTALGSCIATGDCICEKITKSATENYDFVPVKVNSTYNSNIDFKEIVTEDYLVNKFKSAFKEIKMDINDNYEAKEVNTKEIYSSNACKGCECASICTDIDKANCNKIPNNVEYSPNIENKNGVIKLKNTFDIDFKVDTREKFVLFNTCKDIIGNCIVGGDGCLCARMIVDEQQAMAQEIEDITPQPKRRLNM